MIIRFVCVITVFFGLYLSGVGEIPQIGYKDIPTFASQQEVQRRRSLNPEEKIAYWVCVIHRLPATVDYFLFGYNIPSQVADILLREVRQRLACNEGDQFHTALKYAYCVARIRYSRLDVSAREREVCVQCLHKLADFGHKESMLFLLKKNRVRRKYVEAYAQGIDGHPRSSSRERLAIMEFLERRRKHRRVGRRERRNAGGYVYEEEVEGREVIFTNRVRSNTI